MTDHHESPTMRLHPLKGDAGVAPDGDAGGDSGSDAKGDAVSLIVAPLTVADRVGGVARRTIDGVANAARELWLHPDRLIHAAWHGNAKTLAQHRDYIKSRGWVPPEMTGKAAGFITVAGIAYHVVIARYVKAACKAVDGAADYPLRFLGLLVFLAILIVLLVL